MDRVGALSAAVQTGKSLASFMPWSKDPKSNEGGFITEQDVEQAARKEQALGVDQSSRVVASKPSSMLKSSLDNSRVVPSHPEKKNTRPLTLEERRERLRKMKHDG